VVLDRCLHNHRPWPSNVGLVRYKCRIVIINNKIPAKAEIRVFILNIWLKFLNGQLIENGF
jgi:hypothetical protein